MTGIGVAGSNCTGASIGADERQPWLLDWLTIIGARRAGRRHF